jgi:hypothetical protein
VVAKNSIGGIMKAGTAVAVLICVAFGWVALTAAVPQTTAPPAPVPTGADPSLEDTLKFIQDKLGTMGAVTFTVYITDNGQYPTSNDTTWTFQISNVHVDQSQCSITYHAEEKNNHHMWPLKIAPKGDVSISLRKHPVIAVKSYVLNQNEFNLRRGLPRFVATATNPDVSVLWIGDRQGNHVIIPFTDIALATRLGNALNHAADLCSDTKQEPF